MGKKRTAHRRWPSGYPSGFYIGRGQGFTNPNAIVRWAGGARRLDRSLAYLGHKPAKQ